MTMRQQTLNVMLRRSRAFARDRLEAWQQAPSLLPSFETVARLRERPPQSLTEK